MRGPHALSGRTGIPQHPAPPHPPRQPSRTLRIRIAFATLLTFLFTGPDLGAQLQPPTPTPEECESWEAEVALGDSAAAHALLTGSPPVCRKSGPQALAGAIRAARLSRNVRYLEWLALVAGGVRQLDVFQAALEVAADRTASTEARVLGVLVAANNMSGSQEIEGFTRAELFTRPTPSRGVCGFGIAYSHSFGTSLPLPEDAERMAARVIDGIRYRADEPELLRNLARCARSVIDRRIPPQVDTPHLVLSHVCGGWFRIWNEAGPGVKVYVTTTSGQKRDIRVVEVHAAPASFSFNSAGTESVMIEYEGGPMAEVANTGVECPPE